MTDIFAAIMQAAYVDRPKLPPVKCQPWCAYGHADGYGHDDVWSAEDQWCQSADVKVELSLDNDEPMLMVCAMQYPGEPVKITATMNDGPGIHLTVEEAAQLADGLRVLLDTLGAASRA